MKRERFTLFNDTFINNIKLYYYQKVLEENFSVTQYVDETFFDNHPYIDTKFKRVFYMIKGIFADKIRRTEEKELQDLIQEARHQKFNSIEINTDIPTQTLNDFLNVVENSKDWTPDSITIKNSVDRYNSIMQPSRIKKGENYNDPFLFIKVLNVESIQKIVDSKFKLKIFNDIDKAYKEFLGEFLNNLKDRDYLMRQVSTIVGGGSSAGTPEYEERDKSEGLDVEGQQELNEIETLIDKIKEMDEEIETTVQMLQELLANEEYIDLSTIQDRPSLREAKQKLERYLRRNPSSKNVDQKQVQLYAETLLKISENDKSENQRVSQRYGNKKVIETRQETFGVKTINKSGIDFLTIEDEEDQMDALTKVSTYISGGKLSEEDGLDLIDIVSKKKIYQQEASETLTKRGKGFSEVLETKKPGFLNIMVDDSGSMEKIFPFVAALVNELLILCEYHQRPLKVVFQGAIRSADFRKKTASLILINEDGHINKLNEAYFYQTLVMGANFGTQYTPAYDHFVKANPVGDQIGSDLIVIGDLQEGGFGYEPPSKVIEFLEYIKGEKVRFHILGTDISSSDIIPHKNPLYAKGEFANKKMTTFKKGGGSPNGKIFSFVNLNLLSKNLPVKDRQLFREGLNNMTMYDTKENYYQSIETLYNMNRKRKHNRNR